MSDDDISDYDGDDNFKTPLNTRRLNTKRMGAKASSISTTSVNNKNILTLFIYVLLSMNSVLVIFNALCMVWFS